MHAFAPLPTRSRGPSRAQSHRPRYRPHASPTCAPSTRTTPTRAPSRFTSRCRSCLHAITFSLCHSPDLTEPPHATKTQHTLPTPTRHERPPPAHIATLPSPPQGGSGGGTPLPLLALRGRGRQPPEPRPHVRGWCASWRGGEDYTFPCARSHPTRRVGGGACGGPQRPPFIWWCR